mmetsp:Transcript_10430/g.22898  ORF Transcript_10430/g.22898 Transcript_10430/m.22898 type:complete len:259 (-) Transcript_10430:615-1391(-)
MHFYHPERGVVRLRLSQRPAVVCPHHRGVQRPNQILRRLPRSHLERPRGDQLASKRAEQSGVGLPRDEPGPDGTALHGIVQFGGIREELGLDICTQHGVDGLVVGLRQEPHFQCCLRCCNIQVVDGVDAGDLCPGLRNACSQLPLAGVTVGYHHVRAPLGEELLFVADDNTAESKLPLLQLVPVKILVNIVGLGGVNCTVEYHFGTCCIGTPDTLNSNVLLAILPVSFSNIFLYSPNVIRPEPSWRGHLVIPVLNPVR